jgi:hypothetical protein
MRIGPKTWLIGQSKTINKDENGQIDLMRVSLVTLVSFEKDCDTIPIFTTEEKAASYIKLSGEDKACPVEVRNLGVLGSFLEQLLEIGLADSVTFDIESKGAKGSFIPLREFLDDLRKGMRPP